MIKGYILFYLTIASFLAAAFAAEPQPNIPALRKQLVNAIDHKQTTDSLYSVLGSIKQPTGLITGYVAALEALKAKHTWNPYYKIKYLGDSESTFKKAVELDPHNIEIRFMRFSVEHNVPGFLGYNKDLVADKLEIIRQIELKNYEHTDRYLVISAIKFMLQSGQCTPAENDILHKQLTALK